MSEQLLTPHATAGTAIRPAIELRGLTKRYGPFTAVEDVSLDVAAGQVLGLLGPNGAGKTTTIKMMASLVTPTAGTARLGGYDITKQRSRAVQQIGAVLEGSRNVYWSLSAWQNLLYFGRVKGLRSAEIKPRAERLLRDLDLWERRNERVGGYSRGMQQKVAVAAALMTDPPIVLLDEPTIGLDVEAARTVRQWLRRLAHDEGKTVVLTTHQLAMAEELADRVAVIRSGRIITDLPPVTCSTATPETVSKSKRPVRPTRLLPTRGEGRDRVCQRPDHHPAPDRRAGRAVRRTDPTAPTLRAGPQGQPGPAEPRGRLRLDAEGRG